MFPFPYHRKVMGIKFGVHQKFKVEIFVSFNDKNKKVYKTRRVFQDNQIRCDDNYVN